MVYASAMIVVGFQAILFAVFARIYAMTEGFLPEQPELDNLMKKVTLETGLLVGGVLILGGVALAVVVLAIWGGNGFNALDYRETLRVVIPSGTMLVLGVQTVLASLFLSILGIRHSRN
jgi:ABC-type uncharacterized transport system permease subunit